MTNQAELKNSTYFLQAAIDVQVERGKQYDAPGGERSMGRTVQAFNAINGRALTEAEGWLMLQVLKDVRQGRTRQISRGHRAGRGPIPH
ncbi:hypothetical protein [Pseudomonas putida]|uniref:hypothetical protein n=1 Tax=Pseudomonas putida TaxID=303 RepID=UPI00095399E0|nr:hypothetical protein [Pseudomonas putida]SIR95277.1 hypothetical protein SAMN05216501_2877 [Pseudomonas putida]